MNLLLEADRIDDRLKETSLSESIFATGSSEKKGKERQGATSAEFELTADAWGVSETVDASFDGTSSMDGCTDTSISCQVVLDDCMVPKKRKLCREQYSLPKSTSLDLENFDDWPTSRNKNFAHCSPEAVTSSSSISAKRRIDQNDQSRIVPFKTREYSWQKKVGSRCYAQWPGNGKFFWGFITKATGHGPHRKYSVST